MCNNKKNNENNNKEKQKPNFLCKYCNDNHIRLHGTSSNGKKRYRCMNCNKTFSIEEDKRIKHSLMERILCLLFYISGSSMTSIQKSLSIAFKRKIYFNSIDQWIKNSSKQLTEELKKIDELKYDNSNNNNKIKPKNIKIVEMDEMFIYIKKNPEILKENHILIKDYGLWLTGILNQY